jgi:phage/conjugal plasmid C-4 type zinc finger TraR family protein
MSNFSPDFDLADRLAEAERESSIAAARAALVGDGEAFCVDCGVEIPPGRRAALPNATRCVVCASFVERGDFV